MKSSRNINDENVEKGSTEWYGQFPDGRKVLFKVLVSVDKSPVGSHNCTSHSVTANLMEGDEKVGYLLGNIIERPNADFLGVAFKTSKELGSLASFYCDNKGFAYPNEHPDLQTHGKPAMSRGGFFHISCVEIKPELRGKFDLGLRMVHETLVFLDRMWSLAVLVAKPLTYCIWKGNTPMPLNSSQGAVSKLQKYWARMGFAHCRNNPSMEKSMLLAKDRYFPPNSTPSDAISGWLSKEIVEQQVDLHPPTAFKLDSSTFELHLIITQFPITNGHSEANSNLLQAARTVQPSSPTDEVSSIGDLVLAMARAHYLFFSDDVSSNRKYRILQRIEELVRKGASIDRAQALHIAASRGDVDVVVKLIDLGAEVNMKNDEGLTPLHLAASHMHGDAISALLSSGADKNIESRSGLTPLQLLNERCEELEELFLASDSSAQKFEEAVAMMKLDSLKLLLPSRDLELLSDGWLSPRMRKMLEITAVCNANSILAKEDQDWMPMLASDCIYNIPLFDYIPLNAVGGRNAVISKDFNDGWGVIFTIIGNLVKYGLVPTVDRIQGEFPRMDRVQREKLDHYLEMGGMVEFAVDALLDVTENVLHFGKDGWEYNNFREGIEGLDEVPVLDSAFDIARVMCIYQGGGYLAKRGPHFPS